MFDLGWTEMMLVGVVALIVVGPKELPNLFRAVGQAVGKARGMAREFSRAMEAAADEAGVKEINRTIQAATRPVQFGTDSLRKSVMGTPGGTAGRPAAPLDPGTPLEPGAPAPGPATKGFAAQRAEEHSRRLAEAASRAEARAAAGGVPGGASGPALPDHVPSDGTP
ncbi:Sec-independent protein translocase protein TatB [Rubellimicrobium aerolatum]|uniref:Sec-independent protein translocase protein TatB n=1 Tax=Rubellimicrobium aerolatum TaxID=490979 RepID=A0ABW0SBW2_9RHOB|nr:Sec-independent protein translocase protein TatB [Rubellimicrobium aerolatum]MBP1805904.1 sec-independent protein translocase protein TatB [Rubellimicrobium aerolatum]